MRFQGVRSVVRQTVVVSGMHSGDNPSPGLGVCRSLRHGEAVTLIGLDYSPSSSGLHSPILDRSVIMPSWKEIDRTTWFDQISQLVAARDALYIPCLDGEARVIAEITSDSDTRFLSPSADALKWATKPATAAAESLKLQYPVSISADATTREVERFIAESPSGVWVKGQHYEAYRAFSLSAAMHLAEYVQTLWGPPYHIERHMDGRETAISFVANRGKLLGSVYMQKSHLTGQGKTWAGTLSAVEVGMEADLRRWIEVTGWHGAGELELVEDWYGRKSLLEINPRFPAWIYGATVHGHNLCTALITGSEIHWKGHPKSFTRTVEEIAVKPEIGLISYPWSPQGTNTGATKHPSGMPFISNRSLFRQPHAQATCVGQEPTSGSEHLAAFFEEIDTPRLALVPEIVASRIQELKAAIDLPAFVPAYSIKTNPDQDLMKVAAASGFLLEAISAEEASSAADIASNLADVILNGPLKWHPNPQAPRGTTTFIDSLFEFDTLARVVEEDPSFNLAVLGLRLSRGPSSRFGIDLESSEFHRAVDLLARWCETLNVPWGIHFHQAESVIGTHRWVENVTHVLDAAAVVKGVMQSDADVIDLGGGWDPRCDAADIGKAVKGAMGNHGHLFAPKTRLVLELGKWLVESCGVLYTTVVGHRRGTRDIIVDAGIPDVPETQYRPHRIEVVRGRAAVPLGKGDGRILGRTCMETDIIAARVDVSAVKIGDRLAVLDVGAYDYSMRYRFARGARGQTDGSP